MDFLRHNHSDFDPDFSEIVRHYLRAIMTFDDVSAAAKKLLSELPALPGAEQKMKTAWDIGFRTPDTMAKFVVSASVKLSGT